MDEKRTYPSDQADKVLLRMPDGMRDRLKEVAKVNNRTMNAEIIDRLQATLDWDEAAKLAGIAGPSSYLFKQAMISVGGLRSVDEGSMNFAIGIAARGSDGQDARSVGRSLAQLPPDLYTQYGLHLYNNELKTARLDLEGLREDSIELHAKLQALLADEAGPPGPKMRASTAVTDAQRRIGELENQIEALKQTINSIHTLRKSEGLPELRNVREVSSIAGNW